MAKLLYVFNNIRNREIIDDFNKSDLTISRLISFGIENGLTGNLWKKFIVYTLIFNLNSFTKSIEFGLPYSGESNYIDDDLKYFYDLYMMDTSSLAEINDFKFKQDKDESYLSKLINECENKIDNKDFINFKETILSFYINYGVGEMAIYRAFRVDNKELLPIKNIINVSFDDLIGYEEQKRLLIDNTENFLNGNAYNNVLLYGDSGTGKSTSIKALLTTYFNKGLRIIEVYKHQMEDISRIIYSLKERPYHYIIYMDDLSFEEDEISYKYLKSVIEGGIEAKPDNVVIYATSNRRHLIRENFSDNATIMDDLHRNETQAEKLSLSYRFGLQIYYGSLSVKQFRAMVKELARKNDLSIPEDILIKEASAWELTYGSLSGRCAEQFIKYISNKNV
ncbi:MAG: ATP-binding protein [Anaeroplasma sp.]